MSDRPAVGTDRHAPAVRALLATPTTPANLVDGAYSLGLFGDVATELCIRTDGDEGLFAGYADVQFHAPVRAGDVVEVDRAASSASGTAVADGSSSPSHVVCRGRPDRSPRARPRCSPSRCS